VTVSNMNMISFMTEALNLLHMVYKKEFRDCIRVSSGRPEARIPLRSKPSLDTILSNCPVKVDFVDRLCGLVVRVPGYRSRCPGSIPCATRFSEK
jgi:hypothetical protein